MSGQRANLYTKNAKIWIPSKSNVWQCGQLLKDYAPGDQSLDYEIIADDIGGDPRNLARRASGDSSSSSNSGKHLAIKAPGIRRKISSEEDAELQVGDKGVYLLPKGEESLPPLRNPGILIGENDLTSLSYLHEPAVLYNLRKRFIDQQEIYTYCGIVLVAINPYQMLDIYTEQYMHTYQGRTLGENDPHIFAIAEESFRQMKTLGTNQSIIVTGESGAGKTVSAKFAMRYFATIGGGSSDSQIEQKVLSSNPIMEAIGNAKTTRNDNSSRFGKYIDIAFNKKYEIIGAAMRTYLLEKSRLIFQAEDERNYHVFYQMCASREESILSGLDLGEAEEFKMLYHGECTVVDSIDDEKEFKELLHSFSLLGIGNKFQSVFFRVLASILHLTNMEFDSAGMENSMITPESKKSLLIVCSLLGIDAGQFEHWLCSRRIVTMGEVFDKGLTKDQAQASANALAKHTYQLLFDKVVTKINKSLAPGKQKTVNFIGVLDIYGFEWFQWNSFEQFCINYANEKLQQQFCKHVFKLEQEEYLKEEIEWKMIDYDDNKECIALIEARLGILDLLDEACRMPKGNDQEWAQMLYNNHEKKAKHFVKPRMSRSAFQIVHFADTVEYQCDGFVEKNRDAVSEDLLDILRASEVDLVCEIFKKPKEEVAAQKMGGGSKGVGNRKKKLKTVGSSFRTSLQALMDTLESTTPHYVRCIKPNDTKSAFEIYPLRAVQQLRACGVLETIKISSAGYPSRWTYEEFFKRYRAMIKSSDISWKRKPEFKEEILKTTAKNVVKQTLIKRGKVDLRTTSTNLLNIHIPDENQYQMGKTKIFFRAGQVAYMEKVRSDMMYKCAVIIQKTIRCYQSRKSFITKRRAAVTIQRFVRGFRARKLAQSMREEKAAIKIQKTYRGYIQHKKYQTIRESTITIQAFTRGMFARALVTKMKQENAAVKIQSVARMFLEKRRYEKTIQAIIFMQCCQRRKWARKEFKRLKMEAKSVDHIKSLNKGLENKILQLQVKLNESKSTLKEFDVLKVTNASLKEKLAESGEVSKIMVAQKTEISGLKSKLEKIGEKFETEKLETEKFQSEIEKSKEAEKLRLEEIEKLRVDSDNLSKEITNERVKFEAEREVLKKQVADAEAEEIKRLTEELEGLRTIHQKKSLDYDRLEQKYENIKQELHYTRVKSEKVQKSENVGKTGLTSSNELNSSGEVKNESDESDSEDEDMDRLIAPKAPLADLDLIQPDFNNNTTNSALSSPNTNTSSPDKKQQNVNTTNSNSSSINPDNSLVIQKNKELEQKLREMESKLNDYQNTPSTENTANSSSSANVENKKPPTPTIPPLPIASTSNMSCMTDPLITEGIVTSPSNETNSSEYKSMEKDDLAEILAKTISHNRILESDSEQMRSGFEQQLNEASKSASDQQSQLQSQLAEISNDRFSLAEKLEEKDDEVKRLKKELRVARKMAQGIMPKREEREASDRSDRGDRVESSGRERKRKDSGCDSTSVATTIASNATVTASNSERLPNQPSTSTMPRSQSQRLTGLLSYLTGGTTPTTSTPTDSTGTISERRKGSEDYDTQSILSMGPGETAEISRQQRHALSRRQAMLQYEVGVTTKVVKCLISEMHPEKVVGMLPGTPVYALFMALRYADNVNNEIMVKQLLSTSMQYTKRVIRKNSEDVTMLSFWLANIVKLLCLFKQYSGEEEFSKRNTTEQNQHNLLNFDLCEFRQVFHDMAVSAYQRLVQASERKIKPLIIPAMLEEDTIQGGRGGGGGGGMSYNLDEDDCGHTALESMLIQMSKWNVMFHKHGLDNGLIRQFFNQIFYFITSTTLNTQLVRKELCNWSKAMQIRYNTSQLEDWLRKEKLETNSITERLEPLVQVSQLLQVNKESEQDADEIVQLCTKLSAAQVCKLLALVTPVYDHEKRVSVQFTKMVQEKMTHKDGGVVVGSGSLLLETNFMFGVNFAFIPSPLLLSDMAVDPIKLGLANMAQLI